MDTKESDFDLKMSQGNTCGLADPLVFVVSPPSDFPFDKELVATSFKFDLQVVDLRGPIRNFKLKQAFSLRAHAFLGTQL